MRQIYEMVKDGYVKTESHRPKKIRKCNLTEEEYEYRVYLHDKWRLPICIFIPLVITLLICCNNIAVGILFILPATWIALFLNILSKEDDKYAGDWLITMGRMEKTNETYKEVCKDLNCTKIATVGAALYTAKKGKDLVDEVKDPDKWKRI